MRRVNLFSSIAALATAVPNFLVPLSILTSLGRAPAPAKGTGRRRVSKYTPHQGKRECARRRRQMQRANLQAFGEGLGA